MKPAFHRDGTITYWSVYARAWIRRARTVPDREFAAMNDSERARVTSHLRARDGASGRTGGTMGHTLRTLVIDDRDGRTVAVDPEGGVFVPRNPRVTTRRGVLAAIRRNRGAWHT